MDETQEQLAVAGERWALSVTEAAARLGISRAHAYRMVATGELPAVRLGGRMVVPVHRLRALLGEPLNEPVQPAALRVVSPAVTSSASASGRLDRFRGSVEAEATGSC